MVSRGVDVDVVVIGAGLSGLTAARGLLEAGVDAWVLEARERVGGRTLTVSIEGEPVDLGGQWLGPTQDRALALTRALGIETFPQYTQGKKVLALKGERKTYGGLLPRIGLLALAELGLTIQRLERMARKVPLEAPYAAEDAAAWDGVTVAEWLTKNVRAPEARTMLEIATHAIFAAEPAAISLLFFLYYTHSGGSLTRMAEARDGAQSLRLRGGAQALCEGLAAPLGERLRLAAPVVAIEQEDAAVAVSTASGAVIRARRVIVAVPPALAHEIAVRPALPAARLSLHAEMAMGSVVKCVVTYERPFWREVGLSGEVVCDGWPLRMVFDDCSYDASQAALVGFVVGGAAARFAALPEEGRRSAVIEALVGFFGDEAAQWSGYVDHDWSAERWSRGCYVGVMPRGLMTRVGAALRAPCGAIHFAGTETASRWVGYLDGAIEAGERAAAEVIAALAEARGDV